MSVSTNIILFYGIATDDELDYEYVLNKLGVDYNKDLYGRDQLYEYLPSEIESDLHGESEVSKLFIYDVNSYISKSADCGMGIIDIYSLPVPDGNIIGELTDMAEKLGWDEPSWKLVSYVSY